FRSTDTCRDYSSAEDGRWVFTPDSTIWRRLNSILQKVPGGRSGHAQAIHRAVQSTELDRCLPELFPSHNSCNKDGRCPQRLLTPSVRLARRLSAPKRSAHRIGLGRRVRAAVALAYPAMGTDCGLLRRFADAPRSTRLPNARRSALVSPGQAQFGDCLRSPARPAAG